MRTTTFPCALLSAVWLLTGPALAQPKLPLSKEADTLPRLPDDQIEGSIWEYKGTLKEGEKTSEDEDAKIEGRFRIEGKAIFDASPGIPLPDREQVKSAVEKARAGKLNEIKLPGAATEKRIGEYRKLANGRLRLDFNDADGLHGAMTIWKKKETDAVWMGTYNEIEKGKSVAEYVVELRFLSD